MKVLEARQGNTLRVVKLMALMKLRRAILEENYEACPSFIDEAKQSGAKIAEIKKILNNPQAGFEGV